MKKNIMILVLLSAEFLLNTSQAASAPLANIQIAYFVGTHTRGPSLQEYVSPKFVYQYQAIKTPAVKKHKSRRLNKTGKMCKKSCWLDRWTGKALSCLIRC